MEQKVKLVLAIEFGVQVDIDKLKECDERLAEAAKRVMDATNDEIGTGPIILGDDITLDATSRILDNFSTAQKNYRGPLSDEDLQTVVVLRGIKDAYTVGIESIPKMVFGAEDPSAKPEKEPESDYDPDLPCNKKGCDTSTRASCCGCKEMLEYERKRKGEQYGK